MEVSMDITEFLTALGIIIMIDIVLGGDNAVVIALASRNLPEQQRNKAIIYGTGLAIAVRVCFTLIALWLLSINYLMLIGGLILCWIALKLLTEKEEDTNIKSAYTLGAAIKTIVIADVVMGVDNVLAIAGASHGNIWLVILGLLISVPIIVWGSKLILKLLDKYPVIIYVGAAVLAYTAGSMITHEPALKGIMIAEPYLKWVIPVMIIGLVLLIGYVKNSKVVEPSRSN
jgi:YjbE family integral membrane protein